MLLFLIVIVVVVVHLNYSLLSICYHILMNDDYINETATKHNKQLNDYKHFGLGFCKLYFMYFIYMSNDKRF